MTAQVFFFTRALKTRQFKGYIGGFPSVRIWTDIDYVVSHGDGYLTSAEAWGQHPLETNLLSYVGENLFADNKLKDPRPKKPSKQRRVGRPTEEEV